MYWYIIGVLEVFLCVPDVFGHLPHKRNRLTVHLFLLGFILGEDLLGINLGGADLVGSNLGTFGCTCCLGFFLVTCGSWIFLTRWEEVAFIASVCIFLSLICLACVRMSIPLCHILWFRLAASECVTFWHRLHTQVGTPGVWCCLTWRSLLAAAM